MPDKAGVELLLHRYDGIDVNDHMSEGSKIVKRLGGLALAIDQASAYMKYMQFQIDQLGGFLAQYYVQRKKVLRHTTDHFWKYTKIDDKSGQETAISAFTTWEMSFQHLLAHCNPRGPVEHFLTVTAFLGPDYVSESLFEVHRERSNHPPDWADIFMASGGSDDESSSPGPSRAISEAGMHRLQERWDADRFWRLIRQAYQMSLLQNVVRVTPLGGATLILHPLIRDWLQLRVGLKERQTYTYEAIDIITSSLQAFANGDRVIDATTKQSILLHMDATLVTVKDFFWDGHRLGQDITSCENADWFALFYQDQGRFNISLDLFRTVMTTRVTARGTEHPSTLISINNLGRVLIYQGKYEKAEQMLRDVVETEERVLGKEHPDTLTSISNLATVLMHQGKYEKAEQMLRDVVEAKERVLGKEHPDTLRSINNLATVLIHQRKYEKAEQILRDIVEAKERVLGKEHPDTLTSISNLATVLIHQGKHEKAEQILRDVVEAKKRVLGKEHLDTLISISNLATVLIHQGKHKKAEQMLRDVVETEERVLGKEHLDTLISISNLARVLMDQGKHEKAEQILRDVVEAKERVLGKEHPDTLISINNLGRVLIHQRKYEKAEQILRDVVEAEERVLGKEHPHTLRSINNLATALAYQGKEKEAEQIYRGVIEVMKRVLGKEHPDTLGSMNDLSEVLREKALRELLENTVSRTTQRHPGLEETSDNTRADDEASECQVRAAFDSEIRGNDLIVAEMD